MSPRANSIALAAIAIGMPAAGEAACSATAVAVAHGAYNPKTATADDATGSVTVTCNPNAAFSIALSDGGGTGYANRRMVRTPAGFQLTYQLYNNSGRTTIWGDGTAGTSTVSFTSRASATQTVWGRIPALQNVGAGSYSDTVVVTITY